MTTPNRTPAAFSIFNFQFSISPTPEAANAG
jgi:hypothetical protein